MDIDSVDRMFVEREELDQLVYFREHRFTEALVNGLSGFGPKSSDDLLSSKPMGSFEVWDLLSAFDDWPARRNPPRGWRRPCLSRIEFAD